MSALDRWVGRLFGVWSPAPPVQRARVVARRREDVALDERSVLEDLAALTVDHGPWEAAHIKFNKISERSTP